MGNSPILVFFLALSVSSIFDHALTCDERLQMKGVPCRVLNPAISDFIIAGHNNLTRRNAKLTQKNHKAKPIAKVWDQYLADHAQAIADRCEFGECYAQENQREMDLWFQSEITDVHVFRLAYQPDESDTLSNWKLTLAQAYLDYKRSDSKKKDIWDQASSIGCGFAYTLAEEVYKYDKYYVCAYGKKTRPLNFIKNSFDN